MIVHYKLPNQGWLEPQSMDLDMLWHPNWVDDRFYVDTEAEYDFLEGYGLVKGKQLHLTLYHAPTHKLGLLGPLDVFLWLKDINTNTFNPRIPRVCESDISSG